VHAISIGTRHFYRYTPIGYRVFKLSSACVDLLTATPLSGPARQSPTANNMIQDAQVKLDQLRIDSKSDIEKVIDKTHDGYQEIFTSFKQQIVEM